MNPQELVTTHQLDIRQQCRKPQAFGYFFALGDDTLDIVPFSFVPDLRMWSVVVGRGPIDYRIYDLDGDLEEAVEAAANRHVDEVENAKVAPTVEVTP